jgi:hypothetical protein
LELHGSLLRFDSRVKGLASSGRWAQRGDSAPHIARQAAKSVKVRRARRKHGNE